MNQQIVCFVQCNIGLSV